MALRVLEGVGKKARARALANGRQFSSESVRDQADDHLQAVADHLQVKEFGIDDADITRMSELRAAVVESVTAIGSAGTAKKVSNLAYERAMVQGKGARKPAQSLLRKAERKLRAQETDASEAVADSIATVQRKNGRAGDDAVLLAAQLVSLSKLFTDAAVVAVLDAAQVARVSGALTSAATALADAAKTDARFGGTANEEADIVEGLIIEICREWRANARDAANDLGSPAIADAFELRRLYPSKPVKKPA